MTDLQVGGVTVETLHGATPALRLGTLTVEVLTSVPPPTLALGGVTVEVLTPIFETGGSNVYDDTGVMHDLFLLKDTGLEAQTVVIKNA